MKASSPELHLDQMSAVLIQALQKDRRRSYSSLGTAAGLAEPAPKGGPEARA